MINERRSFKSNYFEEEKIRMAGVEYALEQTGLYARKDDLLAQRNKEIITPYFILVSRTISQVLPYESYL